MKKLNNKTAVLVVNLGSPDEPTVPAVRRYLAEFLSDKRVIDLPRWQWLPILYGIILRFRPASSAKLYQSIWTDDGSPLVATTNKIAQRLQACFNDKYVKLFVAMRYGNPSMDDALQQIIDAGYQKLIVLPLYPQFSYTTVESIRDKLTAVLNAIPHNLSVDFIEHYFEQPLYTKALVERIKAFQSRYEKPDKLIFSYHGIPKRYATKGDIYPKHCQQTTENVAGELGLEKTDYLTTFQSRFGREEWLQPYTDKTLTHLAQNDVKIVHIISPAFAADCLETLEELEVENRDYFETAGGKDPDNQAGRIYRYISALNDGELHIDLFESIIRERLSIDAGSA